ncbi:MAG: hypothetical protein JNN15_14185 [Blastocatellia bacterium]|nr:hypothetical protein [Blastocatellia bacterium]
MSKRRVLWPILSLLLLVLPMQPTGVVADSSCEAPELICKASSNQNQSLTMRDHCRYQQRASVQLYKKEKSGERGKLDKNRETTAIVEPASQPDETGRYPVVTKVVSDTDDKGKNKNSVDPNARTILSLGAFFDIIFFPLLPEKIRYYEFKEVGSDRPGEKLYSFRPKTGATQETLASGQVYINAESGAVLTIKVDTLHNLELLDKNLKKLENVYATVDYSEFDGKYRMPTFAKGGGSSDVKGFKGIFTFTFEESKYNQVLKL